MAKINRKQFKAAAKQNGVTGKTMRKQYQSAVKTANGGISRGGRLVRGGLGIVGAVVPGIGGAIANVVGDKLKKPQYLQDSPVMVEQSPAEIAAEANANIGRPANPNTSIINSNANNAPRPIPPALQEAPNQAENKTMAQEQQEAKEEINQNNQTGTSYMPTGTGTKTPPPAAKKDNKKMFLVIGGIVAAIVVCYFIAKSTKK